MADPTITDEFLAGAERRADAATGGLWWLKIMGDGLGKPRYSLVDSDTDVVCRSDLVTNAAHIAGLSPPVVKAWIARTRADASTIAEQAKRIAELEDGLRPFGPVHNGFEQILFGQYPDTEPAQITTALGNLRRAACLLSKDEGGRS